jgi:iron(III) transport system substrate-binding protein
MPRRLPTLLTVATTALALTLSACGSGGSGSTDETLVVYSGRTQNLIEPLLDRFEDETEIKVEVRYGDTAELALLLDQEGDNTDADVFLSQSPGAIEFLAADDRLATLADETLDTVDPRFRDPAGRWVGVTGRQRVLVYNQDLVDEADLPSSVLDLTDERYRGRFAVAPSNGSFQDFVSAMRAAVGDDETLVWLEGIAANGAATYANNNAIVDAVARGEVEMGLVNHYYNFRFLAENPDMPSRNHVFEGGDLGALVIVSGAAVLEGSDVPEAAARLVEFLLSEESQQYFRDETLEYPLRAGVDAAPEVPSLTDQELPDVDLSSLGEDLEGTLRLIQQSGLGA